MLRQNHSRSRTRTKGAVIAFPDPVESVARRDDPGICGRPFQILAEVLEYRGMFWRNCRKVVEGLVNTGRQTCGGYIVSEDASIHHLREKAGLRDQFVEHVWNIFLPLWRKCFLIARASAKGDDNYLPSFGRCSFAYERAGAHECRT